MCVRELVRRRILSSLKSRDFDSGVSNWAMKSSKTKVRPPWLRKWRIATSASSHLSAKKLARNSVAMNQRLVNVCTRIRLGARVQLVSCQGQSTPRTRFVFELLHCPIRNGRTNNRATSSMTESRPNASLMRANSLLVHRRSFRDGNGFRAENPLVSAYTKWFLSFRVPSKLANRTLVFLPRVERIPYEENAN